MQMLWLLLAFKAKSHTPERGGNKKKKKEREKKKRSEILKNVKKS